MRSLFFIFILLFYSQALIAQSTNYSTKDKKAIELLEQGKQMLVYRKFKEAIYNFEKAAERDKNFLEAYIALSGCYRVLRDEQKVKTYLLTAFSIKPNAPELVYEYYTLGAILLKEGDYKNGLFYLDKFFEYKPTDKRVIDVATRMKENALFAQDAMEHPLDFTPEALPEPLNKFQNQYFPSLTADGNLLLYTVRNATGMLDEENLYFSERNDDKWLEPQQISTRINTKENEGASSIAGDGKTLVYTYCTPRNGCDLYITRKVGKDWTQPVGIGNNVNTAGWESHPALSADGRTLYFSSDRRGGLGREDIWVTVLDSNDIWQKPKNLGSKINTEESDITPFIHANNNTLYFASRGWIGLGGSDLFMSEKLGDTSWTQPKNLGYPLNTNADEMAVTISSDFSTGYYSKDKLLPDKKYSSTLYTFKVPESIKSTIECIYLKGKVVDDETNLPIKASIALINLQSNKSEQNVFSDPQSGDYLLVIPDKKNFGLFVSAKGYLYKSLNFNTNDDKVSSTDSFVIRLKPIKINSTTALRNIFFESGKYNLDKASITELNMLAKLIKDNSLKIEIDGHTDAVGSDTDNKILSEKRAQAVYNYLTSESKISKNSVSFKGFGATKPIADNTSEEGKKQNRRIEIKILSGQH